jgi:hypothetical protein
LLLLAQRNWPIRATAAPLQQQQLLVVIHAKDAQNLEARPVVIDMNNGSRLFLPLVVR